MIKIRDFTNGYAWCKINTTSKQPSGIEAKKEIIQENKTTKKGAMVMKNYNTGKKENTMMMCCCCCMMRRFIQSS